MLHLVLLNLYHLIYMLDDKMLHYDLIYFLNTDKIKNNLTFNPKLI